MKNITRKLTILIMISIPSILVMQSCYYDSEEELYGIEICITDDVTYNQTIVPIIEQYCLACHTGTAASGGVSLESYTNVKLSVDNGSFLGSINHESGYSPMPKDQDMIPDCDIAKIEAWINKGAQND